MTEFVETPLRGVILVKPRRFGDERGYFMESFQRRRYAENGIDVEWTQDNLSRSTKGVLRGLHYQLEMPQGKLVSVTQGAAFDVAVDIRRRSATFGQWYGVELTEDNRYQLWIPPGFAHGFLALSDNVDLFYKCAVSFYDKPSERCINHADSAIGVDWHGEITDVNERDATAPPLSSADLFE